MSGRSGLSRGGIATGTRGWRGFGSCCPLIMRSWGSTWLILAAQSVMCRRRGGELRIVRAGKRRAGHGIVGDAR